MKMQISLSNKVEGYTGGNGLYAWVQPCLNSIKKLVEFVAPLQIKDVLDLHCTIMTSKKAADKIPAERISAKYVAHALTVQTTVDELVWWEGHDKSGYLVAKLDASPLQMFHDKWKDFGCEPTFPDYEAHITLVNPCEKTDELEAYMKEHNAALRKNKLVVTLLHEQISDLSQ